MYGRGISKEGCLVDLGSDLDVVQKSGAWYSYGEMRLGQGREKTKDFLRDNPEIAEEIEAKIRQVTVEKAKAEAAEADRLAEAQKARLRARVRKLKADVADEKGEAADDPGSRDGICAIAAGHARP